MEDVGCERHQKENWRKNRPSSLIEQQGQVPVNIHLLQSQVNSPSKEVRGQAIHIVHISTAVSQRKKNVAWIRTKHKCWHCGQSYQAFKCTLNAPCKTCNWRHLIVLYKVNKRTEICKLQSTADILYLNCLTYNCKVLLNASEIIIINCDRFLGVYTVLDDGSQRSSLLLYNQLRKQRFNIQGALTAELNWG